LTEARNRVGKDVKKKSSRHLQRLRGRGKRGQGKKGSEKNWDEKGETRTRREILSQQGHLKAPPDCPAVKKGKNTVWFTGSQKKKILPETNTDKLLLPMRDKNDASKRPERKTCTDEKLEGR